jgi:hypothetical protein
MGVRLASVQTNTILASPVNAAEAVIATTGPLNLIVDTATVFIQWYLLILIGASGANIRVSVRRGTLITSTIVTVGSPFTATAGNTIGVGGSYFDNPAGQAEVQYSLTALVGASAAANTVSDVSLIAFVL